MFNIPNLNQLNQIINPSNNIPDWLQELIINIETYNEQFANDLRLLYKFIVANSNLQEIKNWFDEIQNMRQYTVDTVPYTTDQTYVPKTRIELALNIFWSLLKLLANDKTKQQFAKYLYDVKLFSTINAFTFVLIRERGIPIETLITENRTDIIYNSKSKLVKLPEHTSITRPVINDSYSFVLQPEFVYRHTRIYESDMPLFVISIYDDSNKEVKQCYCYFDSANYIISGIPGQNLDIVDQSDTYTQYLIPVSANNVIIELKNDDTVYIPSDYPLLNPFVKQNMSTSYLIAPKSIVPNTVYVLYQTDKGEIIPEKFGDNIEVDKVNRVISTDKITVLSVNDIVKSVLFDNDEDIIVPLLSAATLLFGFGTYSMIKATGHYNEIVDSTRHTIRIKLPNKDKVIINDTIKIEKFDELKFRITNLHINAQKLRYGAKFLPKTKEQIDVDFVLNRVVEIRIIDNEIYFVIPDILKIDEVYIRMPYITILDSYLRPIHYLLYPVAEKLSKYIEARELLTFTESYVVTSDFTQMKNIYSDIIKKYNEYEISYSSMLLKQSYDGTFIYAILTPQNFICDSVVCEIKIDDMTHECNVEYIGYRLLDKFKMHLYKCNVDIFSLVINRHENREQRNIFITNGLIDDILIDISAVVSVDNDKFTIIETYKVGSLYNNIEFIDIFATDTGIVLTTYGKTIESNKLMLQINDYINNDCIEQHKNNTTSNDILLDAVQRIIENDPNNLLTLYDNVLFDQFVRKCIPPIGLQINEREEREDKVYMAKNDFYIKV